MLGGFAHHDMQQDTAIHQPSIRLRRRFCFLAAAWTLAFVAIAIPDPHALQLWPFFPLGVFYVLNYALDWDIAANGDAISAVGWLLYFVLTCSALLTSKRAVYF